MAGLSCPLCLHDTIEPEVHVYYNNQFRSRWPSALKAENVCLDNSWCPAMLKYVYVCKKCGYEDTKLERLFTERV